MRISDWSSDVCSSDLMNGILQVQCLRQRDQVGGVGIHVIAIVGLARPAMAATVMRDDTIASGIEKEHLVVPFVAAERPAMMEHDRLRIARTPVLEKDPGAVTSGYHIEEGSFLGA